MKNLSREEGGQFIRLLWIGWAASQPNPKASHTAHWDLMPKADQEADMVIWDGVFAHFAAQITPLEEALEAVCERLLNEADDNPQVYWRDELYAFVATFEIGQAVINRRYPPPQQEVTRP